MSTHFLGRIHGFYQREISVLAYRRPCVIAPRRPVISFTFDDFPSTALENGGGILKRYGVAGTYYASLGLCGQDSPSGRIFVEDDVEQLLAQGHELGCHTFSHCHSWDTDADVFENAILRNQEALRKLIPGAAFKSFSYPISQPRPRTKARTARYFQSCRGGGQKINEKIADLNYLAAFFLEKTGNNFDPVKAIIDYNKQARGWLVLATHDVCDDHGLYGCTPDFFERVVAYAVQSGGDVLTVNQAVEKLAA